MKILLATAQFIFWGAYAAFFGLSLLVSASNYTATRLPFYSFIVQSASMEPTIKTGDVIFSTPQDVYTTEDIVTFTDNQGRIITHRIMQADTANKTLITKGDNNDTPDPEPVQASQVIAQYQLKLPKAGYLLVFAQRPTSIFLLIAIPLIVLVAGEVFKTKPEKHDQTKLWENALPSD